MRIFEGVFRIAQEQIPFVVEQVTSLLGAGKSDEVGFAVGGGEGAKIADEFGIADIQFMRGDQFAVETDFGQ